MSEITFTVTLPEEFQPTTWLEAAEELTANFLNPLALFVEQNKLGKLKCYQLDHASDILLCDYYGMEGLQDLHVAAFFHNGLAKSCEAKALSFASLVSWEQAGRDIISFFWQQSQKSKARSSATAKLAQAGSVLQ